MGYITAKRRKERLKAQADKLSDTKAKDEGQKVGQEENTETKPKTRAKK